MASKKKDSTNFEATLTELEGIVQALETGDLSLEDSLTTFERGIGLTRQCQTALQDAEQRVSILMEQDGVAVEVPFETPEAE